MAQYQARARPRAACCACAHAPSPWRPQNYATYVKGPVPVFSYTAGRSPARTVPVTALLATIALKAAALVVTLPAGTSLTAASLGVPTSTHMLLNLSAVTGSRSLTIECAMVSEPPACSIDGEHKYQLVEVHGGAVTLVGLALRNGRAPVFYYPGGVNPYVGSGGAIDEFGGSVDAAGDAFSSDSAGAASGGAVAVGGGYFNATGALFRNNTALNEAVRRRRRQRAARPLSLPARCASAACSPLQAGGAVEVDRGGVLDARGATFELNRAARSLRLPPPPGSPTALTWIGLPQSTVGGAVVVFGGVVKATGAVFESNTAYNTGRGYLSW